MIDTDDELAGLKDFQRDTARYAFRRMYLDDDATMRFLVADEAGLGKTLVARAVIAQAITYLQGRGEKRIDIVYVCSNAAIAAQNIRKLAPTGLEPVHRGRLSLLPGQRDALRPGVNLIPLSPGTSMPHLTKSMGTISERALAHQFLSAAWGADLVENVGGYRVFAGNIGVAESKMVDIRRRFDAELTKADLAPVRGTKGPFGKELAVVDRTYRREVGVGLRDSFEWLTAEYRKAKSRRSSDTSSMRSRFVGHIRQALAATGAALLHPDLVIFDEFQRFADLLHDSDTDVHTLVHRLIAGTAPGNAEPTRTLLLSATPYRMHTTDIERAAGGDEHHHDLLRTIGFLTGAPDAPELAADLRNLRRSLTHITATGPGPGIEAAERVSVRLRKVMARTERLASTPDRDGMLETVTDAVAAPTIQDIRGYVAAARLVRDDVARDHELVELWKSTPYLLSFLGKDIYQAKGHMIDSLGDPDRPVNIPFDSQAALPWADADGYRPVDAGNPRLRRLLTDMTAPSAHRLLWLPPSIPYYQAGGEFASRRARTLTKRIVFSSWNATPTAISALTSYEVERQTVGAQDGMRYTSDTNRRSPRPLRLTVTGGRPASMTTYLLIHPSTALADLADPLAIGAALRATGTEPTRGKVLAAAADRLRPEVDRITANHLSGTVDVAWYWLAPILLDLRHPGPNYFDVELLDPESADDEPAAMWHHLRYAIEHTDPDALRSIGAPPADLVDVLAEVAVGSPAVTALRAIRRVLPDADPLDTLYAAGRIAQGFRDMFNGAEATAILRNTDEKTFWRACLRYAVDGNLQAVLDEYVHVLVEWQRYDTSQVEELGEHVHGAANLRAATYRIESLDEHGTLVDRSMRGRYATRFGQEHGEQNSEMRVEHLTRAFNSPFWPFVLATTSVGQEGLDFHLYCHAVVHWNLPRNPVDLEQREGRVHRYKNHAVRKNVADKCGPPETADGDPWQAMFDAAARLRKPEDCEINPYWVFPGQASIERHLFVPPYTQDASALPRLLASTAMYRLAFGQPRQQELIDGLSSTLTEGDRDALRKIRVDLRPPPPPALAGHRAPR